MNRRVKFGTVSLLLSLFVFCSCSDFDEINRSKTKPEISIESLLPKPGEEDKPSEGIDVWDDIPNVSEEELANLALIDEVALFRNFSYEGVYNDHQRGINLFHDLYAGYFANNKPDFNNTTVNYNYSDGWAKTRWEHFYQERCKEYSQLSKKLKIVDHESGRYKNAYYITQIHYSFLASMMADTYGSIPFSIFLDNAEPGTLTYDSQEKVYDLVFQKLAVAVENLDPAAGGFVFPDNSDNCYNGDVEKWIRFANTLRLRLALRISNVDPERAKEEGEAALANIKGLMRSNADNMKTTPLCAFGTGGNENVHALVGYLWVDVCMSKDIEEHYYNMTFNNRLDPRCPKLWFKPFPKEMLWDGDENDDPDQPFVGRKVGEDSPQHESETVSVIRSNGRIGLDDNYWWSYDRESVWLSYSETQFLLAEAALRGWAGTSSSVQNYFEEGIRQNMRYYKIPEDEITDYIANLKIYYSGANPFTSASREEQLEHIITQKWLAVFPNGLEGWAEFRRTDYPRLHVVEKCLDSNIMPGMFIKRISYPVSEHDSNYMNLPLDIDSQGLRVWWDVADTNSSPFTRAQTNNFR